jgi:hypothetical protein
MRLLVSGAPIILPSLLPRYEQVLGHLLEPVGGDKLQLDRTRLPWALDNGAFKNFNPERFRWMLKRVTHRPNCLFLVCPDRVGDAVKTLELFRAWAPELATFGPVAFVGQDGAEDLEVPWDDFKAYFVGGSTEWKLSRASCDLVIEAKRRGKWCHLGRVNSFQRMQMAYDWGCDSVDGTKVCKFSRQELRKFCGFALSLLSQQTIFSQ